MPQESVNYAVGRISMLRRDAMDMSRLERLLAASSYEEAKRTLSEIGWTGVETTDYEQLALSRVADASEIVRSLTTDERVTDCFLLKYDIANLKMLLKARCLGVPAEYLSESGTLPVDSLRHAVNDHSYGFLPEKIAAAMDELEKELVIDVNPMAIDVKLDRAMYALIQEKLAGTRCKSAKAYFSARADVLGGLALLRARQMRRDVDFFVQTLLPGGTIAEAEWCRVYETPEALPGLLSRYGRAIEDAARAAVLDFHRLPALEKALDNELLRLFVPYKYETTIENVIGYLLAIEREAAAVRLVMAGKQAGFSEEAVRERLRDLYG